MTTTVSAFENPDLVNEMAGKVLEETKEPEHTTEILEAWDNMVDLPGGYMTLTGELIPQVEVKELTGRDEEIIGKSTTAGRQYLAILTRGALKAGDLPITEKILDGMLVGDRDAIMLGIYKATFGPDISLHIYCEDCGESVEHLCNVDTNIPVRKLEDPFKRDFTVEGRKTIKCILPTGLSQKTVLLNPEKSMAELTTDILVNAVVEMDGVPVYSKNQVLSIGVADRRKIGDQLLLQSPGPQLNDAEAICTACGGATKTEVNIGAIFRF